MTAVFYFKNIINRNTRYLIVDLSKYSDLEKLYMHHCIKYNFNRRKKKQIKANLWIYRAGNILLVYTEKEKIVHKFDKCRRCFESIGIFIQ